MLLMKKRFFAAVRAGNKTATLRYWRWPRVQPGSIHTVPGLGKVRIEAVRAVEPQDLTDEDAWADGFEDLAVLRRSLRRLYPAASREARWLYQVRFTLL